MNNYLDFFNRIFEKNYTSLDEITRANISSWDSIKHIELILALEDEFGISFSTDEISKIKNANDIVYFIKMKTK